MPHARPRVRLLARNSATVRRFGSCARSEQLLSELQQWATANGLPPQVDPSAFLRLGLELLSIETHKAATDLQRTTLAKRIEKAAAAQWIQPREPRSDPANHLDSLPPVPLRQAAEGQPVDWDAFNRESEALFQKVWAERKSRRRKTT